MNQQVQSTSQICEIWRFGLVLAVFGEKEKKKTKIAVFPVLSGCFDCEFNNGSEKRLDSCVVLL